MAEIILNGPEPFDLIAQRHATSIAANGIVATTLPVSYSGLAATVFQIRLLLTLDEAENLSKELSHSISALRSQLRPQ